MKAILAAALVAGAAAAHAHVTLDTGEAPVGASYKAVLRVPHGCEGEATLKLRVQIPEGMIAVKPMAKASWTLETIDQAAERRAIGRRTVVPEPAGTPEIECACP